MPRQASVSLDTSRMSTVAISAPDATAASVCALRASARTGVPDATSLRTMTRPSWPVAPTTSTREFLMATLLQFLDADVAELDARSVAQQADVSCCIRDAA